MCGQNLRTMARFEAARAAEIIRAGQRDAACLEQVGQQLTSALQRLAGVRIWMRWRKELEVAASVGYFALTTLAGYQTLGEEYVNIVQVSGNGKIAVPSFATRGVLVLLHCVGPYILDMLLLRLENILHLSDHVTGLSEKNRQLLLEAVPRMRWLLSWLRRCHLALFYVNGFFYDVAKRATGVRYLMTRRGLTGDGLSSSYRWLGTLALFHLTFSGILDAARACNQSSQPGSDAVPAGLDGELSKIGEEGKKGGERQKTRCVLCFEVRQNDALTPCGHLYCWGCVHEWLRAKSECPVCREMVVPSQIVYLHNYQKL